MNVLPNEIILSTYFLGHLKRAIKSLDDLITSAQDLLLVLVDGTPFGRNTDHYDCGREKLGESLSRLDSRGDYERRRMSDLTPTVCRDALRPFQGTLTERSLDLAGYYFFTKVGRGLTGKVHVDHDKLF